MSRHPRPDGKGAARAHHIDAIAHHFLSSVEGPAALSLSPACLDVAVAAPGSARAAACAAAGLAAIAAGRSGRGSCLLEDESVAWSAFSYLAGPDVVDVPAGVAGDLPAGLRSRWLNGRREADDVPGEWVRWRLLGEATEAALAAWEVAAGLPACARPVPLRWSTLVWCVTGGEAAMPGAAACLARLATLLSPGRVEFLVVPDAWGARPGGWRPVARRPEPAWRNVAHLQDIARNAAYPADVVVRVYPDDADHPPAAGASLLGEIVSAVVGVNP
jgi:hypothetical protein